MENPSLRKYFRMPDALTGVVVTRLLPCHHAHSVLRRGDVVTYVDGEAIANDGTIRFRNRERIMFDWRLLGKYAGDTVELTLWREGAATAVPLRLDAIPALVPPQSYDTLPRYFVHAGLVFVSLVGNYFWEWGSDWFNTAPRTLVHRATNSSRFMTGMVRARSWSTSAIVAADCPR